MSEKIDPYKPYIYLPESQDDFDWEAWPVPSGHVTKIVLGKLDETVGGITPPPDLAKRFPNLALLHLWGLDALQALPELPAGLKELDVRGCKHLEALPELPSGLEVLDLGECSALAPRALQEKRLTELTYLHLDGCIQLKAKDVETLLEGSSEQKPSLLREFTAAGCDQWAALEIPPLASLRKLVLTDCSELRSLEGLEALPALDHLNLNGCEKLEALPLLHKNLYLQYFLNHDCPALRTFAGLDVRTVHRSESMEENVAETFKMLQRTRGEPAELVMAKILFLGSGRCGKTTTAKALQWYDRYQDNQALDPHAKQPTTHGIQFFSWDTDFSLQEINAGVNAAGTAQMWDFGGQELYHNTHRLFAAEGALFVIVTTAEETHAQRIKDELAEQGNQQAFKEENEFRKIKYWLDYVKNAREPKKVSDFKVAGKAPAIHIVYTGTTETNAAKQDILKQAADYGPLILSGEIPVTAIDFSDRHGTKTAIQAVLAWAKRRLGVSADELGIRVPALVKQASDYANEKLESKKAKDHAGSFDEWEKALSGLPANDINWDAAIQTRHAGAVARHLHNCGRIFWLRHSQIRDRLIYNQKWAIDLIYGLFDRSHPVDFISFSSKPFAEEKLRKILEDECRTYQNLESDAEKDLFVDYLEKCNICKRIHDGKWIAVASALLPRPSEKILEPANQSWAQTMGELGASAINYSFVIAGKDAVLLGNSDYLDLLAEVAKRLKEKTLAVPLLGEEDDAKREGATRFESKHRFHHELWLWQNGFQSKILKTSYGRDETLEQVVLRVAWRPFYQDPETPSFQGGLFIELLCSDEECYGSRLDEVLFGKEAVLGFFKDKVEKTDLRPNDLSFFSLNPGGLRGLTGPDWTTPFHGPASSDLRPHVAISYRNTEQELANEIESSLLNAGLSVFAYKADERDKIERGENGTSIVGIYDRLRHARVIIFLLSREFFEEPDQSMGKNLYTPVEVIDAVDATVNGYSAEEIKNLKIPSEYPIEGRMIKGRPPQANILVRSKNEDLGTREIPELIKDVIKKYLENVGQPRAKRYGLEPMPVLETREDAATRRMNRDLNAVTRFCDLVSPQNKQLATIDPNRPDKFVELLGMVRVGLAKANGSNIKK